MSCVGSGGVQLSTSFNVDTSMLSRGLLALRGVLDMVVCSSSRVVG